jgi:deaminated glutathione amidase
VADGRLHVALVQHAAGLEPAANRALLDELTPRGVDLAVFPEAFARDFGEAGSDISGYAEPVDGPFATELERVAIDRGSTLLAGLFETSDDPGRPYSTLVLRGAARADYRKVHLYDSFGTKESDRLSAGPITQVAVPFGGFTLGLMNCYDLRFPEQGRALVDAGADVLVVPAAWVSGERKVDHWRTLLRARAIENTTYVVGVGQPAPRYSGHSLVVDPLGDVVVEGGDGAEVLTAVLEREALEKARRTNPSLANRRR